MVFRRDNYYVIFVSQKERFVKSHNNNPRSKQEFNFNPVTSISVPIPLHGTFYKAIHDPKHGRLAIAYSMNENAGLSIAYRIIVVLDCKTGLAVNFDPGLPAVRYYNFIYINNRLIAHQSTSRRALNMRFTPDGRNLQVFGTTATEWIIRSFAISDLIPLMTRIDQAVQLPPVVLDSVERQIARAEQFVYISMRLSEDRTSFKQALQAQFMCGEEPTSSSSLITLSDPSPLSLIGVFQRNLGHWLLALQYISPINSAPLSRRVAACNVDLPKADANEEPLLGISSSGRYVCWIRSTLEMVRTSWGNTRPTRLHSLMLISFPTLDELKKQEPGQQAANTNNPTPDYVFTVARELNVLTSILESVWKISIDEHAGSIFLWTNDYTIHRYQFA